MFPIGSPAEVGIGRVACRRLRHAGVRERDRPPLSRARVLARLIRIRRIQVLRDERPWNAQTPWITASQVS